MITIEIKHSRWFIWNKNSLYFKLNYLSVSRPAMQPIFNASFTSHPLEPNGRPQPPGFPRYINQRRSGMRAALTESNGSSQQPPLLLQWRKWSDQGGVELALCYDSILYPYLWLNQQKFPFWATWWTSTYGFSRTSFLMRASDDYWLLCYDNTQKNSAFTYCFLYIRETRTTFHVLQ